MAPRLASSTEHTARNLLSEIFNLASQMKHQGTVLIDLSIGEPSFDTLDPIKNAAIDAINAGFTKYTSTDGILELKAAIIAKYQRQHDICLNAKQIVADAGAKPVLNLLMGALLDAGDRVVTSLPCYSCYFGLVSQRQGVFHGIETQFDQGFRLNPAQLEAALEVPTKVWLLNNPCNPTGVMYRWEELQAFAEVLRRYPDTWIIIDEVYEMLAFDNHEYVSLAAVAPDLQDRIIIVNSVSKSYAMTGWRLGFAIGATSVMDALRRIMDTTHSNPCSISQVAAAAALNGSHTHLTDWCAEYARRRDQITRLLQDTPVNLSPPQAGMFHFIHCGNLIGKRTPRGDQITSSSDWVTYLLREWQVVVVPGTAFGLDPYFRISMVAADTMIEQGVMRITKAIKSLE